MDHEAVEAAAAARRRAAYDSGRLDTTDGRTPESFDTAAPGALKDNGQHTQYWVLSEAERAKGFVRPVRTSYIHQRCGGVTTMGRALAETYARDFSFYSATMCVHCGGHYPVGADGEFLWTDTTGKVGT